MKVPKSSRALLIGLPGLQTLNMTFSHRFCRLPLRDGSQFLQHLSEIIHIILCLQENREIYQSFSGCQAGCLSRQPNFTKPLIRNVGFDSWKASTYHRPGDFFRYQGSY